MYLLEFVNQVRQAQSYEGLAQLPPPAPTAARRSSSRWAAASSPAS